MKLKLVKKLQEKKIKNFQFFEKNYLNEFTKSDIYQNKKYIGEIEFSRKKLWLKFYK